MLDREEELERLLDQIHDLVRQKQYAAVRDLLLPLEPPDIAQLLEESGPELMPLLYRLLPKELAAEVFVELESDSQEMLINGFSNTELKEVLDELYLDDAVDIVEEMPATVVIRILDKATPEMRKSINEMLKYPEDSAGSIMNVEYLSLKKDMTSAASAASWRPSTFCMSPTPLATSRACCPSGTCSWPTKTTASRTSWTPMWSP